MRQGEPFSAGIAVQDKTQAFNLYKQAADKGDRDGIYHLAQCYENGWGIKENQEEAQLLFELAATRGHPKALAAIGRLKSKSLSLDT